MATEFKTGDIVFTGEGSQVEYITSVKGKRTHISRSRPYISISGIDR